VLEASDDASVNDASLTRHAKRAMTLLAEATASPSHADAADMQVTMARV